MPDVIWWQTRQLKHLFAAVVALALLAGACRNSGLPKPSSKTYAELCSAFYLGLAGLQAGEDARAKEYLTRSTEIAPGEPAGWADLGILQVRQQQFDAAFQSVDKARSLDPSESRLEALLGLIESRRGKLDEAAGHLKKAVALNARNVKAMYSLAEETELTGSAESQAAAAALLKQILQQQPSNQAVLLDALRLAAKRGDVAEAQRVFAAVSPLSVSWPDVARQQLTTVEQSLTGGNPRAAAVQVQFLRNVLLRVPAYREDLDQIKTPATLVAQPFTRFLRLPTPSSEPAPPDLTLHFDPQPIPQVSAAKAGWIRPIFLSDQGPATLAWADGNTLQLASGARLPLPGARPAPLTNHSVAVADLNYDFKADLSIATESGLRIYQQQDPLHFRDVTQESRIPAAIANGTYTGVWAFDIDLDGDLDLILGVPHGEPVVLRNNGDGTFSQIHTLKGMDGLTAFAAADIDGDGDPDMALVDGGGNLRVLLNERLGVYKRRDIPSNVAAGIRAVAAADINGDGALDFVLLKSDSSVARLSEKQESSEWDSAEVVHATGGPARNLLVGDLDNNGAMDIIVDDQVFLSDGQVFTAAPGRLVAAAQALSDIKSDGRLDILGVNASGAPVALMNRGSKNYHWQVIRTRAAQATGDQRINSYGIGGEIEVRSELLAQKQVIDSPVLHFGLGEHTSVQFARIVWPNGFVQAEFDLKTDQTVLAEQRIKGSCPMLFGWNGHGMQFLKDVGPWGSALGLNVNAQGTGIYGTREWFHIRGDQLVPHDGFYDLRITAEYWETYYMDHYSLLAIDHPSGSEVYTDERFALPSPAPNLVATTQTKPFARATDDNGTDVTEIVRDLDDRFLDTFGRGQYQGLTRDHWIELTLPADAPAGGPLYLVGQGWIHDTDATIVKAQAQNSKAHPQGLSIEVPDAAGRWTKVRDGLGFPKGRVKTIVLDIGGIFRPGAPRRLRLRTNLEIYWDKLAWGAGMPQSERMEIRHLGLAAADLRFRGFSLITKANASSPELPHYDVVAESNLRWHDQEGYATRYGDVRELLESIDDRYVITSPGDELRMKFAALPTPAQGWRRDFILICDGWVKDGDYNSTFAGTILPLPYHAMNDYVLPPTSLEADHAYQLHPNDWRSYQTRYVTPHYFVSALWDK
ncbi:MAG TPA: FG-GAP-like repeat-containing protein [Bryobacteraceae bacterium]|nr:FG-GAP-like repeat-containing protein [Bryobacteraceae bacterium]